jgi:protease I
VRPCRPDRRAASTSGCAGDIDKGDTFAVDRKVSDVSVDDDDALLLPGGTMNPDKLRIDDDAVGFVREFVESGKPIGVTCHGPWTLVEADVVRGRTITSWSSGGYFSLR